MLLNNNNCKIIVHLTEYGFVRDQRYIEQILMDKCLGLLFGGTSRGYYPKLHKMIGDLILESCG